MSEETNTEILEGAEPLAELEQTESAETIGQEETALETDAPVEAKPEDESQPDPEQTGVQKRINKITADKYREKQRADSLQTEIDLLKKTQSAQNAVPPKLEDFDYDDEAFKQASIKFEVGEQVGLLKQQEINNEVARVKERAAQDFFEKVKASNLENYSQVAQTLTATVSLSDDLIDVIQQDENGPALVYFLGNNLDKADDIASSSPLVAAAKLGRLSESLSKKNVKKKVVSNAPNPLKKIKNGGGAASQDFETMSMEQLMESP